MTDPELIIHNLELMVAERDAEIDKLNKLIENTRYIALLTKETMENLVRQLGMHG